MIEFNPEKDSKRYWLNLLKKIIPEFPLVVFNITDYK